MEISDDLFARLARSPFRQRFRLGRAEYDYASSKGEPVLRQHAAEFVAQRLAPAQPENDGKQTPDARPSGVYRPARHRELLSWLSEQVAQHRTASAAQR